MKPPLYRLLWLTGNLAVWCLIPIASVRSQIAADGSLPSRVTTSDKTNFTIELGSRVGNNLFHSFREFSVPAGGSAFFNNAADVQNIISRVTGGKISNIDGLLKANGTANLFLLNPNGIIFGAGASLDVGGSFIASTADRLKFADGKEFSATDSSASPLLTISIPVGLQFGPNTGRIVNRSQATAMNSGTGQPVGLQVQSGRTLALVGGEVNLEGGNLTAPGGRIEVGSLADNSLVNINPSNTGLALSYEGVQNFQDIHLSGGATIDVTNFNPLAGSGDVRVQGRRVTLTDGSQIASFTIGSVSSGSIAVMASESVELIGTGLRTDPTGTRPVRTNLTTTTIGDGNAGDLSITTKRLIVQNGGGVFTTSVALPMQNPQGRAGNLKIMASESVEISGSSPTSGASALNVATSTNGNAGALEIITPKLILRDGAEVSAATSGAGRGGTLTVMASESVEVRGTGIDNQGQVISSNLKASSAGVGDAGNLTIATPNLTLRDRGEITVSGVAMGAAGNLEIQANKLQLDNRSRLKAETAAGSKGSIQLDVRDLRLRRNSSITTEATGTASGGNIAINTDTLAALENSQIIANAIAGSGGNIQINTRGIFLSPDSEIAASSQFGLSGTITISNPEVDPSSGLVQLPENLQDPTQQIVVGCAADEGNSLTVTGRGGLPENPTDTIRGQTVWRDWQDFSEYSSERANLPAPNPGSSLLRASPQIVEATGWAIDDRGNIELVAAVPKTNWNTLPNCHTIKEGRSDLDRGLVNP